MNNQIVRPEEINSVIERLSQFGRDKHLMWATSHGAIKDALMQGHPLTARFHSNPMHIDVLKVQYSAIGDLQIGVYLDTGGLIRPLSKTLTREVLQLLRPRRDITPWHGEIYLYNDEYCECGQNFIAVANHGQTAMCPFCRRRVIMPAKLYELGRYVPLALVAGDGPGTLVPQFLVSRDSIAISRGDTELVQLGFEKTAAWAQTGILSCGLLLYTSLVSPILGAVQSVCQRSDIPLQIIRYEKEKDVAYLL